MSIKYPRKASLGWANEIRNKNFAIVLLQLFVYYLAINLIFSTAYYYFSSLENITSYFDYVYFSFVTSLSIGFGDLVPVNLPGKILVILQTSITAMYFALMISILSIKLFYPRELIKFSDKVLYNIDKDMLIIRVINTNRVVLVNPNLRISITEHSTGEKFAGMLNIPIDYNLSYMGKYDFSYSFKNAHDTLNVIEEAKKAIEYNKDAKGIESRFRIHVSITGSYGFNQVALYKKYYAYDIVVGKQFTPITYNDKFYSKKGDVKYNKIKNFWQDFEKIE